MGGLRRGARAAGALAVAGLAGWATLVEPRRLVIREEELALPRWPVALDGLRVALVADLHAGGPHARVGDVRRMAERVARAGPDLVLLLGDFVDLDVAGGGDVWLPDLAAALAPLAAAPLGRVAILGNHDWQHGGRRIRAMLEGEGIPVLENAAVAVGEGERRLWLAGLADLRFRHPDVAAAFADVPADAPVIALIHDPDLFPWIPLRAALSVAGHTHGGQVRIPWLRNAFIPSRAGTRYLHGLVVEDGRRLWVTSGVGQAGVPVRLGRPPEVVVLTLRAA